MADLNTTLAGIRSPNPFWLASAPPTNSGYQVMRAFAPGWGGAECKTAYPDRAIVASLMTDCSQKSWHDLVNAVQTVPVDGFELNFGCPHGMSERGMGSAVGQDPDLVEQITRWTKEASKVPVIVKLTPNITDVRYTARAAARGAADAVSMINTIHTLI